MTRRHAPLADRTMLPTVRTLAPGGRAVLPVIRERLEQPRIPRLDGIRALAVFLVIFYRFGFQRVKRSARGSRCSSRCPSPPELQICNAYAVKQRAHRKGQGRGHSDDERSCQFGSRLLTEPTSQIPLLGCPALGWIRLIKRGYLICIGASVGVTAANTAASCIFAQRDGAYARVRRREQRLRRASVELCKSTA